MHKSTYAHRQYTRVQFATWNPNRRSPHVRNRLPRRMQVTHNPGNVVERFGSAGSRAMKFQPGGGGTLW